MTSVDTTLLNGRVKLLQSQDGLRASMDSVLLAAALNHVRHNDRVLDMGCGTGAVGLCLYERMRDYNLSLHGVDIQERMIEIAQENAAANRVTDFHYYCADVADKVLFERESFDHIVMNPPYYAEGVRTQSPDPAREKAYSGNLSDWIASATHWLKQKGSLSIIHRADALEEIVALTRTRFGAVEIWPIYSKAATPAIRIVMTMRRNRKSPMVIHPPVILREEDGGDSAMAKSILRDGAGLL